MNRLGLPVLPCVLCIVWLGCASVPPAAPVANPAPAPEIAGAPPTIGARLGDLSSRARVRLGLPEGVQGALVREVLYHGPAQRAGLMAADLIEAVDGTPVAGACAFLQELAQRPAGATVTLSVRRGRGSLQMAVPLAGSAELFQKLCGEGDGFACQMLGSLSLRLGEGEEAVAYAAALDQKSCDTGYAEGCSALATDYLEGRGVAADPSRALALFEQACQDGSGSACASYAFQYATGTGGEQEEARATDFYSRACDKGDPRGCYQLGRMVEEGRGAEKDAARALAAYTEACELGSALACTVDDARAAELYRQACEGAERLGGP